MQGRDLVCVIFDYNVNNEGSPLRWFMANHRLLYSMPPNCKSVGTEVS